VVNHSAREVDRLITEEKSGESPVKTSAPKTKTYNWTDKSSGKIHRVPMGIDPGWDYHPGKKGFLK